METIRENRSEGWCAPTGTNAASFFGRETGGKYIYTHNKWIWLSGVGKGQRRGEGKAGSAERGGGAPAKACGAFRAEAAWGPAAMRKKGIISLGEQWVHTGA